MAVLGALVFNFEATFLWLGVVAYSCNPSDWEAVVWQRSAEEPQIRPFRELRNVRDTVVEHCRGEDGSVDISASGGRRVKSADITKVRSRN